MAYTFEYNLITMKKVLVKDLMTASDIIVASAHNTLSEAIHFFANKHLQHLPVLEGEQLVGILSVNDIIRIMDSTCMQGEPLGKEQMNAKFPLKDVMTPQPICIAPDADISEALLLMVKGNIQSLAVCEQDKLVGLITSKDIIRHYAAVENPPHTNFDISTPGFGI